MYACDFEYDSQYLSDYGFVICSFGGISDFDTVSAGSKITFNKVSRHYGKRYSLTGTQYDECITATFDICKNPNINDIGNMEISDNEYRELMRWLNRREFLKFALLKVSAEDGEPCYFKVSFNVEKIKISEKLYGLRLNMESDKPFGYGYERVISLNFDKNTSKILNDNSDEIGSIFPTVIIKCNQDGDITLHNDLENCTTAIKNCKAGEVITLHGDSQIITTSLIEHDICNDFNYEFFRIGNTYGNRNNKITVSLACNVTIRYSPVIKDAL